MYGIKVTDRFTSNETKKDRLGTDRLQWSRKTGSDGMSMFQEMA